MQIHVYPFVVRIPLHIRRAAARLNRFLCPFICPSSGIDLIIQRWLRKAALMAALIISCAAPLAAHAPPRALAQDTGSAKISSPAAGDPLFGLISIQGTASNPNMQRYLLEFDSQDDDVEHWFPIA